MTSAEIRQAFLDYFNQQGHEIVASSPLIPGNDPTLLFTNAGMVQFKDVFLGSDKRAYNRATTSQRCVRAGGKHNDLENVGYTARHHTFFEMLGNFSFGDYFKREAIKFAWEFLTQRMGLPEERLWVTVHYTDDEAEKIWKEEMGVSPERFSKLDEDNFWAMGDTGPCGPCTEIFFDHGPDVAGGPPGSPDEDGDRYIEIWNLVFMQYNRSADGTMEPLERPSIDTGMGLERIAAVMQGVHSNYEIDLFQNLLKATAAVLGLDNIDSKSLRVIADHIRSCAFLITDGVLPSNEGRGYVLRRIMRRAIRHGNKLGAKEPFFHKLVAPLVKEMGDAYPELARMQGQVERILLKEEQQFAKTLDHGMQLLTQAIADMDGKVISGETVFRLYDTYGFPVDLTADVAREHELSIDMEGFEKAMEAQRERARASGQFSVDYNEQIKLEGSTEFTGYDSLEDRSEVVALYRDGEAVNQLSAGEEGAVVLKNTAFYAESGGQVGDQGVLRWDRGQFDVSDCTRESGHHLHHGRLAEGVLTVGDQVVTEVDMAKRQATALNHSATHLLHAALRTVLGEHVQQKGSLVDAERLRFDFAHFEAMTADEIAQVETLVNDQIRANSAVETELMALDAAKEKGAMALFGEKYDDEVRVLSMGGDFSVELCGGTHATRTGDIGLLKVVAESGIASGVRRIEAVTGARALQWINSSEQVLGEIASLVKGSRDTALDKVRSLNERSRQLEKEIERLTAKLASAQSGDLLSQVQDVNGIKVLAAKLEGVEPKALRDMLDQLKNKLGSGVVVLMTAQNDKVSLVAGVTKDLTGQVKAGDLVRELASRLGGKGGGRPDMAQGGGTDTGAMPAALEAVPELVAASL
ncbi:alanine--tRNA ligase [Marinobacterium sp. AK62]|uniref:Alanine--tRNA ligase n=1 Tax=Marinobacterium alkalitolerans TaxID=1542925 RepID=A0ABS3ZEM4_9GAMM|nr:alanine--tRNA ligase [Marinobacterium alkalitolerans]MBP0050150.1 alanine--tRNA ligase [Marinobacterium alkalitolerans]